MEEYTVSIRRDSEDENHFFIIYEGLRTKMIGLMIHVDDIQGVFGDELYQASRKMKPGESKEISINVSWSE